MKKLIVKETVNRIRTFFCTVQEKRISSHEQKNQALTEIFRFVEKRLYGEKYAELLEARKEYRENLDHLLHARMSFFEKAGHELLIKRRCRTKVFEIKKEVVRKRLCYDFCSFLLAITIVSAFGSCKTVQAMEVHNVVVDGEAVNQYGETAAEEAERKALEAAQKEVVIKNDAKKAELLSRKQKEIKNLSNKESDVKESIQSLKEQKTTVLSAIPDVLSNTVFYDCIENAYEEKVSSVEKHLSDLKKDKKDVKKEKKELVQAPMTIVFDPQDVTKESNVSEEELGQALEGTNLQELAPAFVECEKEYGVNAIFLCSIAALESNWGSSRRAVQDNNYTGLGVYSETAVGINSPTPEGNIRATAKRLAENYLVENGMFYNGLSVFAVNTKYCVGCTWGMKVTNIGYRLMEKIQENMK